jgi:hypothetical protein
MGGRGRTMRRGAIRDRTGRSKGRKTVTPCDLPSFRSSCSKIFLPCVTLGLVTWSSAALASGSLSAVAPSVARDLGAVPPNTLVVASPLTSDVPAPRGEELADKVAMLVAGKLGPTAHAHPQAASLPVARAVAAKGGGLLYVQVEVARGQVRVTADLYPVMSNAWDRVRVPAPAPRAHAFASAPIDAEVRTYLAPVALEQVHVRKARHDRGEVLAAACGDIDGDGGMDLALVTRSNVAWGHLRGGKFVSVHEASWAALAPRAPVPFREPLATAAIGGQGGDRSDVSPRFGNELYAGLTDRGGVALSRDLHGAAPLPGLPVGAPSGVGCARPNPAVLAFDGPPTSCFGEAATLGIEPPAARYDTFASFELLGPDGTSKLAVAAREPSGTLHVKVDGSPPVEVTVDGVGAQVVLADLDQDGVLEVVTTADAGEDAIVISSLRGGELRQRVRFTTPGSVRALAVCPAEERGVPALVAVVGGEVWVVR